jgi:hypothetical protein
MQAAIRSATQEPRLGPSAGAEEPAAEEGDGSEVGAAGSTPREGPAEAAAQTAVAALSDQLSVLGELRGSRVRFAPEESGFSSDPEAITRREQSESLASAFIVEIAQQVEPVIAGALAAMPQMLASLDGAKKTVNQTTTEQVAAVHDGAEAARKRVSTGARQARGHVATKRGESDAATDRGAQRAQDRVRDAKKTASGEIDKQAKDEEDDVSRRYREAEFPTQMVGINAGNAAEGVANARAKDYRDRKNGESSILDGPIHDDRLEAQAETAIQVGGEYSKSFRQAAVDQADKLPESKPEAIAKISEVSEQARTGLDDQLKQITDGVAAFGRGAHARTGQTHNRLTSAATMSAKQTTEALNAAEEQQTTALVSQGNAQQQALDEAVSGSLGSLTDGLTESVGQITQSMAEFRESAAEMAPPEPEKLSPVLSDVTGQASGSVATMSQQVQTAAPTMDATLATARDQTVKSLSEGGAAARQQAGTAADEFAGSMRGLQRQATTGFDRLMEADSKTADATGQNAEQGFRDASAASKKAFGLFGEKVDESLSQGRTQLSNSLWSKDNQDKLDQDIETYGKQAADKVQPRWKRVLKWVVTIVVVIAVIAVTVLSAGALGPVGVVLLGAALGAAAGAVTTIAHNIIDGEKWSKGVAKAMIVGAIGGAVGGAGGVLVKGVGSVALRIGAEAVINVAGGVAGEAIGSIAVGESINWTGALVGALIGAGIGTGLGIAGALKGKIRLGSTVEAPAPTPVRPSVEVAQPPAGRLRTALEQARILAPRRAPAIPEGAVAARAEAAPARPPTTEPLTPSGAAEPATPPAATAEPVAPRPVGEPAAPRAVPEPAATRPGQTEPVTEPGTRVPEPSAPPPQPARPSLPENVRPIESAEPGLAGEQPRLRTERPVTTADEFAARVRARDAAGAGEGPPLPEPQAPVESQPVAQAAGAEGYTPQPMEVPGRPPLRVVESGTQLPGALAGRAPLEVRAGAGGRGPTAGGEGPTPGISETRGSVGEGAPGGGGSVPATPSGGGARRTPPPSGTRAGRGTTTQTEALPAAEAEAATSGTRPGASTTAAEAGGAGRGTTTQTEALPAAEAEAATSGTRPGASTTAAEAGGAAQSPRPIPEGGISIQDRRAQGAKIPERLRLHPDEYYYDPARREYNVRPTPREGAVSGATEATSTGTRIHTERAALDRASGQYDQVSSPMTDKNGTPIEVPYQTDLKTGSPVAGKGTQAAAPDAVSYSRSEIMDYKPTGRPIMKDRQEIIRFIQAFQAREGRLPAKIIIKRYDPATGALVGEETYAPESFMPWLKPR